MLVIALEAGDRYRTIAELSALVHLTSRKLLNSPGGFLVLGCHSLTRRIITASLLAAAAASSATAKKIPDLEKSLSQPKGWSREESIMATRLANSFADAWNRRDGRSYGEAYWEDAELVDPSGQIWKGRGAIIQTHVDLWKGPARATHMSAQVRRILFLSSRLFVVDIDTSATGFSPPPPGASAGVVQTRLKHVVQKRNGEWKIVTSQNTFVSQR